MTASVPAHIDTLQARYPLGDDRNLMGVSDGCLGVIRYASAGRHRAGRDRLFPARTVVPFLEDWARLHPQAHLHYFPQGEHDFAYYATHAADELRSLLSPPAGSPQRKKPKKIQPTGIPPKNPTRSGQSKG